MFFQKKQILLPIIIVLNITRYLLCIFIIEYFQELRIGRAIILTSHNMMEADVLGSRVAIMNHGVIVCYGSIKFLKKTFGGFR